MEDEIYQEALTDVREKLIWLNCDDKLNREAIALRAWLAEWYETGWQRIYTTPENLRTMGRRVQRMTVTA